MRLFVGAFLTDSGSADLIRVVASLNVARAAERGLDTRLVATRLWHVTIAFVGDVAEPRVGDAGAAVADAVRAWRAAGHRPPRLRLGGGGTFGRGRSTVLWAGLTGDLATLAALNGELRTALAAAGLPHDDRAFAPHLTLARPGDRLSGPQLAADLATLHAYRGPEWVVGEVTVAQSLFGEAGGDGGYRRLASWPTH
jgi:2'-5' RNA ligase